MRFAHQSEETRIRCLESRVDVLEKRIKSKEGDGGCAGVLLALQVIGLAIYGVYRIIVG